MNVGSTGSGRTDFAAFVGLSTALLALRLYASSRVGFGDSEALYASYALHPQPAYVDHPGLIGVVARAIGQGTAPSPLPAHVVTAIAATLWPWLMALACRACGANRHRAIVAGIIVALVPEMAIGLFAMTPDLLLAFAWTGALALAAAGLQAPAGSARAAAALVGAGVLAGAAAASKVTGALLIAALMGTYAARAARAHARTSAPWIGIGAGLLVIAPVAGFEAYAGWPMLRHRLFETQTAAGLSLRNAGALVGGQLVYLSPLVAVLAAKAARALWRERGDPVGTLLLMSCAVPGVVLVPLCLWSRVAEPHWLAPALIGLVPAAARAANAPSRNTVVAASATAGAMVLAVHAWVLVRGLLRLAPASYDPKLDLANELYGWPEVASVVRDEAESVRPGLSDGEEIFVVGPHWVICAQLDAALEGRVPVGCNTPVPDDFDHWLPRHRWRAAEAILWVTDGRFGPAPNLSGHAMARSREVVIRREGRSVRVFTITTFARVAAG